MATTRRAERHLTPIQINTLRRVRRNGWRLSWEEYQQDWTHPLTESNFRMICGQLVDQGFLARVVDPLDSRLYLWNVYEIPKPAPPKVAPVAMPWKADDGGRAAAGFKGSAGDCVARVIAIITGLPYAKVYADLSAAAKHYGETHRSRKAKRIQTRGGSARDGVFDVVWEPYLEALGYSWTPTMKIGAGCKVHLRPDELPKGRLVVRVSKHVAAVIDGVLHDTHDCSREGTRCVYGYWKLAQERA